MASTNKTTNYNLSQYVGSDKPTYLGDYNGDMQKIDSRMKTNADGFATAQSLAQTAKDTADLAETHAQTGITNASNAQNTATSALTKATGNETAIATLNQKFNLNDNSVIQGNTLTPPANTTSFAGTLNVATNSDGSVAKIYGRINFNSNTEGWKEFSFPSNLRPSEQIFISSSIINYQRNPSNATQFRPDGFYIDTDGTITVRVYTYAGYYVELAFINSLILVSNFGDTPSQN